MAAQPIVPVMRCLNCGRSTLEHCDAHGHACCPTSVCSGPGGPLNDDRHRFVAQLPRTKRLH